MADAIDVGYTEVIEPRLAEAARREPEATAGEGFIIAEALPGRYSIRDVESLLHGQKKLYADYTEAGGMPENLIRKVCILVDALELLAEKLTLEADRDDALDTGWN